MHEVEDLAKASGLAVAFDHTAPTFYRVSRVILFPVMAGKGGCADVILGYINSFE